jgi:hypothetical protein
MSTIKIRKYNTKGRCFGDWEVFTGQQARNKEYTTRGENGRRHGFTQSCIPLQLGGVLVVVFQFLPPSMPANIANELDHHLCHLPSPSRAEDSVSCHAYHCSSVSTNTNPLDEKRFPALHELYHATSRVFLPVDIMWNIGLEVGSFECNPELNTSIVHSDELVFSLHNPWQVHIMPMGMADGLQDGNEEICLLLAPGDGYFLQGTE